MVIISNGFSKFHLAVAAEELSKRSKLSMLLTGAYPVMRVRQILDLWPMRKSRKAHRLLARGQEIDDSFIVHLWFPESMHSLGQVLKDWSGFRGFMDFLNDVSLKAYGRQPGLS